MATRVFLKAGTKIADGTMGNLAEAGADLRAILCMTNNNAFSVIDTAEFVSDVTLDEMDGANYAREVLTTQALTEDAANDRIELTADASVWTALGAGTRQVGGALIYKHVTNDADSPVLSWYDDGGFPKDATGSDFTVTWPADGFIQFVCQ